MTRSSFTPSFAIVLFFVSGLLVTGQEQPRRKIVPTEQPNLAHQTAEILSTNYRVTFSGVSDGKPIGELSMLTCASDVSISGPLNSGMTPTSFTVTGSLEENDGKMLFKYEIGISFPVNTSSKTLPDGSVLSGIDYQRHSSHGMLHMKAGMAYEVLKAGGVVYTVTITEVPIN